MSLGLSDSQSRDRNTDITSGRTSGHTWALKCRLGVVPGDKIMGDFHFFLYLGVEWLF